MPRMPLSILSAPSALPTFSLLVFPFRDVTKETRGTAFVVYAKNAVEHPSYALPALPPNCVSCFPLAVGVTKETRGTAFVVYEDIYDAKNAVEHLSGFNVANRYLIVLYYQQAKFTKKIDQKKNEEELDKMQKKYGVSGEQK
ncbi:unnamed protein product [Closterium sp. NIES-65]|nr:unnamed protein product [Closterium sp. NIES-65]